MKPLTDAGAAHEASVGAHAEMMEHAQAPAFRTIARWIETKIAYTQAAMLQAKREQLPELQIEAQTLDRLLKEMRPPREF